MSSPSRGFALLLVFCAALTSWHPAAAQTRTASDEASLAAAIDAANQRDEHISVRLAEDIVLGEALPALRGSLSIKGAERSISGDERFQIFLVDGGQLRLENLSLIRGQAEAGGAIRMGNGARIEADQVAFLDNQAVKGGAIAMTSGEDRLKIARSGFEANIGSDYGGAIYALRGTVHVESSGFVGNRADIGGGAIYGFNRQISISNSSFSGNWSGGGGGALDLHDGEITLTHLTIVNNRSGISSGSAIFSTGGQVALRNSIVAGGAEGDDCDGGLDQNRGNLSDDGSCGIRASDDPLLGGLAGPLPHHPLQDGSPAIDAADPEFCLEFDQVGTARPQGAGCDIGAIEATDAIPPKATVVPPLACSLAFQIIAANTDAPAGGCPAGNGADTINFTRDIRLFSALPAITSDITIEGNGYSISGNRRFRIFDVAGGRLVINNLTMTEGRASEDGGAIKVQNGGAAIISDSRFLKNWAEHGGAIATKYPSIGATISNSSFIGNIASWEGGAIVKRGGKLNVSNSSFVNNGAGISGGAIETSSAGTVDVSNSAFISNRAPRGGGIQASGAITTLTHVTMLGNSTGIWIYDDNRTLNLRNSIVAGSARGPDCHGKLTQNINNLIADGSCAPKLTGDPLLEEAQGSPAFLALQDGSPALDAAHASFCLPADQLGTARPQGGGCDIGAVESITAMPAIPKAIPSNCDRLYQHLVRQTDPEAGACARDSAKDTITLSKDISLKARLPEIVDSLTIEGNGHSISGGGRFPIFVVNGGSLNINHATLRDGYNAGTSGGAISLLDGAAVVRNSQLINNQAARGGAIGLRGAVSQLSVMGSSFSENAATQAGSANGGAIHSADGTIEISGSSFVANRAGYGGAIATEGAGEASIINSSFSGNRATSQGGAINAGSPMLTMTHLTMLDNLVMGLPPTSGGHAIFVEADNRGASLLNSIIGGSRRSLHCAGKLTQSIGNLVEGESCAATWVAAPQLAELQGMPGYHVPLAGSPALNAADARYCPATDQNGKPRPQVGSCDIGAIQTPPVINALANCLVKTRHGLNFRESPGGESFGSLPEGASMPASARTPSWFHVTYRGVTGWISADYVTTDGDCG